MWGDDQYENFREDIIPPYALLAYGDVEARPWEKFPWRNVWGEAKDHVHRCRAGPTSPAGSPRVCSTTRSTSPTPTSRCTIPALAHAFLNTQLFLDYDRVGFPWPMVCMPVNCYGRRVIAARGFCRPLRRRARARPAVAVAAPADGRWAAPSPATWPRARGGSRSWRRRRGRTPSSPTRHGASTPTPPSDRALYEALGRGDFGDLGEDDDRRHRRRRSAGGPQLVLPDGCGARARAWARRRGARSWRRGASTRTRCSPRGAERVAGRLDGKVVARHRHEPQHRRRGRLGLRRRGRTGGVQRHPRRPSPTTGPR